MKALIAVTTAVPPPQVKIGNLMASLRDYMDAIESAAR